MTGNILQDVYAQTKVMFNENHPLNKQLRTALERPEYEYERGFIDGMQKQMQSSVEKTISKMRQPEKEWVGLTDEEAAQCWNTSAVKTWKTILL